MTPIHAAALEYAARGWYVFPCVPGAKAPIIANGHLRASTDPAQINAWWTQHPDANIGGSLAPSGLYVLDVDTSLKADGTRKRGCESLAKIDHELSDTLTAITGRGGLHAVYSRPPDLEPHRHISIIEKDSGLDLLGEGYIVLAPSTLTEGGVYRWNNNTPIAPLPAFLRNIAKAPRHVQREVQLIGTPIGEGGRNQALFKLGAALRDQGIGAEALARALDAENKQRCTPPLDDVEMGLIVNSVLQRVTPSRDVAIGALVAQEIQQMFAPKARAQKISDIARQKEPPVVFYPIGMPQYDELSGGGLACRRVCGVCGPPSVGKSAFVASWCLELQKHVPVLHFSTELPRKEAQIRYAAPLLGFPWRDGLKGIIPDELIEQACAPLNVWIIGSDDYDRDNPLASVRAEALTIREQTGRAPVIVVDYVQMLARGSGDQARHAVGLLTLQLRMLAQELDCPIIAVFSTSRAYYGGKAMDAIRAANDPTAYLAAAKESGEIEYDCGTIIFLDLDKTHEGQPKPALGAVARCRDGQVGFFGLRARLDSGLWTGDPSALAEMAPEEREGKKDNARLSRMCERLLELVDKMPGRAWRDIRVALKGNFGAADQARAKLIEDGVLEMVSEKYFDTLHREKSRDILRRRAADSPTSAPSEEDGT